MLLFVSGVVFCVIRWYDSVDPDRSDRINPAASRVLRT